MILALARLVPMNELQTVTWPNCLNVREAVFSGVRSASVTDNVSDWQIVLKNSASERFDYFAENAISQPA